MDLPVVKLNRGLSHAKDSSFQSIDIELVRTLTSRPITMMNVISKRTQVPSINN